MKKRLVIGVLTVILTCTCLLGVTACNSNTNSNTFKVGDEVRSSLKLPWTMPIYNNPSSPSDYILDTDTATITEYVLTANRAANIENIDDYHGGTYYRYIYDAKIMGKVDAKFADRVVWVGCIYNVTASTKNKATSPRNGTEVGSDGAFTLEFYVYSNEPITDFTPAQVTIGSYVTYYLTYKNTYNMNPISPYQLPRDYTKRSNTITLAPLRNRTEYEEVNGEYKEVVYEFDGWYNGDILVTQIPQGSTGDMELTAHWKLSE